MDEIEYNGMDEIENFIKKLHELVTQTEIFW